MTIVLLAAALAFQGPREIPNRIDCTRCTIQLTQVATLGSDLVEWPSAISEDRHGRYYVTQPNKRELPVIYDATGRRVGTLGAEGEGPGEFRLAALIAVDPQTDTIFVTDWGTSRLSVFSPRFEFVRSFPFPSANALGVLRNRHLVAMARISDRASIGLPFHIFQRDGQRTRAIGDPSRPFTRERGMFFPHWLATSRRGGFWAVPQSGEYRIEHWTVNGVRDIYLRRRPAWYTALEPSGGGGGDPLTMASPPSYHVGVAEAENGLLWVVTRVADPRRGRAALDTLRNVDGRYIVARNWDQVWDSVVELIDPDRGVVVAAQRFEEMFHLMVLPSGKVVHLKDTESGIEARILTLSLSRGS